MTRQTLRYLVIAAAILVIVPDAPLHGQSDVPTENQDTERIDERNGFFTWKRGAVYFSANGDMDTCIVLRTAIVKDGKMYVQAGAGIVADSVPESEHLECVNKAKALFRAAEEAVRFAGTGGRMQ